MLLYRNAPDVQLIIDLLLPSLMKDKLTRWLSWKQLLQENRREFSVVGGRNGCILPSKQQSCLIRRHSLSSSP